MSLQVGDIVEAQTLIRRVDGRADLKKGETAIVRTAAQVSADGYQCVDLTLTHGWIMSVVNRGEFPLKKK